MPKSQLSFSGVLPPLKFFSCLLYTLKECLGFPSLLIPPKSLSDLIYTTITRTPHSGPYRSRHFREHYVHLDFHTSFRC
ncbi:hypothetical protein F5Y07DRAFT_364193 [Xylaria sp. FL0933]|nr:hypothetical protein F5Y07DRAFT_364193 [Xylaria sp. FL0933]